MSALTLALFLLSAPPVGRFVVDAPLVLTASAPASGVETILVPWAALRGGRIFDLSELAFSGFGLGADVALWAGGIENEGTSQVHAARIYGALEARGLASWQAFSTTHSAIAPYSFVGARAGGGVGAITVFDDARYSLLGLWGLRAGAGVDLSILHVNVRSEAGAGVRDGRFELTSGISLGAVF